MNKIKKDNIVKFPTKLTEVEREIEAIIFAAAEPLSVETIESKLSKPTDIQQSLENLKNFYSKRGINLICISNKWSFRTAVNLSSLMSEQKTVEKNYLELIETLASLFIINLSQDLKLRKLEVLHLNKYFRNFNGIKLG